MSHLQSFILSFLTFFPFFSFTVHTLHPNTYSVTLCTTLKRSCMWTCQPSFGCTKSYGGSLRLSRYNKKPTKATSEGMMARGTRGRAAGINSVQFELVFTNPTLIIISPDSGTLENSNHIFTYLKCI